MAERVVRALNAVNAQHGRAGLVGCEAGEREELCDYVNAALEESGLDPEALEARNGIEPGEIAGPADG